jgi:Cys-rich repeat protein
MKKTLLISAAIIILTTSPAIIWANAGGQKPEKLSVDDVSWNAETQSFEVDTAIQFGIAKAAENADFTVSVTLTITDPSTGNIEYESYNGLEIPKLYTDLPGEPVQYELTLSWDRFLDGELFTGLAEVTVEAQILNPTDEGFEDSVEARPLLVEAAPGCGTNIDCDDGIVCNGDETCNMGTGACEAGTPLPDETSCDNGKGMCISGSCEPLETICPPGTILNPFDGVCVEEIACVSNDDCPENNLCVINACFPVLGCSDDSDCPEGTSCLGDVCFLDPVCVTGDDCADGESCDAGFCQPVECASDSDCTEGFVCVASRCLLVF